ncbi:MAG: putative DNA binding domain-containing protein [Spirochaetia bacterium]|jgi:ATP-dependent DNA helicase RecG|nr:putative DNA binding domain-containing protein [Spirochaetia bacterium]
MIGRNDLELMSLGGENSLVEFMEEAVCNETIAKEIVAFANSSGGRILIGVADNGDIKGVVDKQLQEKILNICRDFVVPSIIPLYEEVPMDDGKREAVITISQGINKPYLRKFNGREEIYIRMGNRCEIATREQMARLFAVGGMLHMEVSPVSGTSIDNLDKTRLSYYLNTVLGEDISIYSELDWIKRLSGLGFLTKNSVGDYVCTIVGLVCFCKTPHRFLPAAGIRFISYDSFQQKYHAQIDTLLDNALVGDFVSSDTGSYLSSRGLIEDFLLVVKPFISKESDSLDENMRKTTTYYYPKEAIRESLINALVHRDWTASLEVLVENYNDRIEITSPGRMQNSMTVEKMIAGQRSPRNNLIVDIMRDYNYVDARGMGVRAKVIPSMKKFNNTEPIYEVSEDNFKVILKR